MLELLLVLIILVMAYQLAAPVISNIGGGDLKSSARTVAVDYDPRSLRAKMRSANKLGARWVVLLGEAEARRHVAQLKDMASGEQVEIPWKELAETLA